MSFTDDVTLVDSASANKVFTTIGRLPKATKRTDTSRTVPNLRTLDIEHLTIARKSQPTAEKHIVRIVDVASTVVDGIHPRAVVTVSLEEHVGYIPDADLESAVKMACAVFTTSGNLAKLRRGES